MLRHVAGRARSLISKYALLVAMAALATFVVYRSAWISDDAIITFRYVSNLRHGHGAVFNVGERVQGYTHPLWFVLLSIVAVVVNDEVYAAFGLSFALTFATIVLLGPLIVEHAKARATGLLVAAVVVVLFATSDSWRAFQTSGLEGPLSGLVLVLFVTSVLDERSWRPWRVLLTGALLVLCRPDFALVVTPAGAVALASAVRERRLRQAAAALTPLLGFVITKIYYGEFLPNTGNAKLGIFTFSDGIHQGFAYWVDWLRNEPVTGAASFALLIFGAARIRNRREGALCVGLVAYLVYLIVIGGDFMRGRLLMPVLVGNCAFGGAALARWLEIAWRPSLSIAAAIGLGVLAFGAGALARPQTTAVEESGIVNERLFYVPSHSLSTYAATRVLAHNAEFDLVAAYIKACGSVTIHSQAPAAIGYYLGPELTVIDTLGLTDRTIARLPRSHLRQQRPRPGHPYKRIPIAYLARRGDVAILDDWRDGMRRLDCSLIERVKPFESDPGLFH